MKPIENKCFQKSISDSNSTLQEKECLQFLNSQNLMKKAIIKDFILKEHLKLLLKLALIILTKVVLNNLWTILLSNSLPILFKSMLNKL